MSSPFETVFTNTTAGYFLLFGIPAGIALGAAVGLILDRISLARARTVTARHEVVGEAPEGEHGDQ